MKCEECLPRIEEYVDGELDGRMMERLTAHLSICTACASELASLQREQEIYAHYQRDITVTPAQWNIVQARIEQEKDAPLPEPRTPFRERLGQLFGSGKQFRPAFVAALILLAVGVTAGILYLNSRRPHPELVQTPKPIETKSPAVVKPDSPSDINRNSEAIASERNQGGSDSNRQSPIVATSAPNAGERRKVAVVANAPRFENRRSPQIIPDESAQVETIAAGSNDSINGARRNMSSETGDFDFEIARHAERAQLLLRSFRNVRMPANNRALDVAYEKENARKLLYQNIALRREASVHGDQSTTEVLNTLEPILLDIANLPDRAKSRDVRSIEQHMEKQEIIATLQVRTLVAAN